MRIAAISCIGRTMDIAFYAPLKPPGHPIPSGDRQMSRLLIGALEQGGHRVNIVSALRAYLPEPSPAAHASLQDQAAAEIERIGKEWRSGGAPDMWFCYHPYYKAPDLIGRVLARRFGIAYATAEASYSAKRDDRGWAAIQAMVLDSVKLAKVNFCFTARDRAGLERAAPEASFAHIKPFIDTALFFTAKAPRTHQSPVKLISVARMRRGDKLESFMMLAQALTLIGDLDWHLTIVGDGPAREDVRNLFQAFPTHRIAWSGEVAPGDVGQYLDQAGIYVWPGCGEAYGLAYLEAQAAGLPVIAQNTAGVPEVVEDSVTGILTPDGDVAAYADAIRKLAEDDALRRQLSEGARQFVLRERSLAVASAALSVILAKSVPARPGA